MPDLDLTPAQRAILNVLSDGLCHTADELLAATGAKSLKSVRQQIVYIRPHLRRHGHDIICQYLNRQFQYRHVITLPARDE